MSIQYRRRVRVTKNTHLNVSKSGVSATTRLGPLTVDTRGRVSVRLGKGLTWRLF